MVRATTQLRGRELQKGSSTVILLLGIPTDL
jgi:hypothetical protein